MLNLLTDPWLPVLRRHSGRSTIRPAQLTESLSDDPVIAIDWPRPDFRIATLEFLIGLLSTATPPYERGDWRRWWHTPPAPTVLDEAFAPFAHAFELDGDGPRFLQDFEDLQSGLEPIERLLIEAPGDATTIKNTDLIVHRDRIGSLGRSAAAIALYTFQSWAPAGGAGNRTGLRGGGPLVTTIVPGVAPTLWHTLWANVPIGGEPPEIADHKRVFPWLAPTKTSEGTRTVTPSDAHPLQCWWGMPRRIRLDFTASEAPQPCDLTGEPDAIHVKTWRQRPRGANYAVWGKIHPLTPHYDQKGEFLPVHPQPGGIGYRHWLGLVLGSKDGTRLPAATISDWYKDKAIVRGARLLAAGYDMDNMKARGFVESEMPLPVAPDADAQKRLDDLAEHLVKSAELVSGLVRSGVRNALFSPGATVKPDSALLSLVRERFYDGTEMGFFDRLNKAADSPIEDVDASRATWLGLLRGTAFALFDEAAPLAADAGETQALRVRNARRLLGIALAGYGKQGQELFNILGRPPAEPGGSKTKREGK